MGTRTWRRLNATRDHRWAPARIPDYVDGGLARRQQRRLAAHEHHCPECARVIATLETLLAVLPALSLPPGAGFAIAERTAERVRARIEEWSEVDPSL